MLDAIREKDAAAGAAKRECVQAGFLSYQHEGAAPEFVYTRNALHHLPDFWKGVALTRIAGLLADDGILQLRDLVFSFDLSHLETGIADWLRALPAAVYGLLVSKAQWTPDEPKSRLSTSSASDCLLLRRCGWNSARATRREIEPDDGAIVASEHRGGANAAGLYGTCAHRGINPEMMMSSPCSNSWSWLTPFVSARASATEGKACHSDSPIDGCRPDSRARPRSSEIA